MYSTLKTHPKLGSSAVYLTERDPGFESERNDCFVKALGAVTGVPYRDAHEFIRLNFKRLPRKGTRNPGEVLTGLKTNGKTVYGYVPRPVSCGVEMHDWKCSTRYDTLNQFTQTHQTGRYLLWSVNHAFALVNGRVYDNGLAGPRTRVTGAYEFIPSSVYESNGTSFCCTNYKRVLRRKDGVYRSIRSGRRNNSSV